MAGNSQRRGATRNPGSKKGASVGTGGHGRKALEGKGPTPKAEDRPYHKAYKSKQAAERAAAKRPATRSSGPRDRTSRADDVIIGRNSVLAPCALLRPRGSRDPRPHCPRGGPRPLPLRLLNLCQA